MSQGTDTVKTTAEALADAVMATIEAEGRINRDDIVRACAGALATFGMNPQLPADYAAGLSILSYPKADDVDERSRPEPDREHMREVASAINYMMERSVNPPGVAMKTLTEHNAEREAIHKSLAEQARKDKLAGVTCPICVMAGDTVEMQKDTLGRSSSGRQSVVCPECGYHGEMA